VKKNAIIIVLLSSCLFSGSALGRGVEYCPPCDATVSWSPGKIAYGKAVLKGFGNDDTARRLGKKCGWRITRSGGYGNTFDVDSCNEGVFFQWTWNSLSYIDLKKGWTGSTSKGIRIGDSLAKFKRVYPNFDQYYDYSSIKDRIMRSKFGKEYDNGVRVMRLMFNKDHSGVKFRFEDGVLVSISLYDH
jgi:hypothetical protein